MSRALLTHVFTARQKGLRSKVISIGEIATGLSRPLQPFRFQLQIIDLQVLPAFDVPIDLLTSTLPRPVAVADHRRHALDRRAHSELFVIHKSAQGP